MACHVKTSATESFFRRIIGFIDDELMRLTV